MGNQSDPIHYIPLSQQGSIISGLLLLGFLANQPTIPQVTSFFGRIEGSVVGGGGFLASVCLAVVVIHAFCNLISDGPLLLLPISVLAGDLPPSLSSP